MEYGRYFVALRHTRRARNTQEHVNSSRTCMFTASFAMRHTISLASGMPLFVAITIMKGKGREATLWVDASWPRPSTCSALTSSTHTKGREVSVPSHAPEKCIFAMESFGGHSCRVFHCCLLGLFCGREGEETRLPASRASKSGLLRVVVDLWMRQVPPGGVCTVFIAPLKLQGK